MKLFVVALCLLSFGWMLLDWNSLECAMGQPCRPQEPADHVAAVLFAFGRVAIVWAIARALLSLETPIGSE